MLRLLTTLLAALLLHAVNAQDFALQFNGTNSLVVPDSSKLEIVNGSGIVFNFWVKADWTSENFYVFDMADSLDYKQGNDNMRFNLRGIKTGVARFGFYFNSASATTVEANLSQHNNKWTQLTCVLNPLTVGSVTSSYSQMIFVNGVMQDSITAVVAAINTGNNSIHLNKGSHTRIGSRYSEDSSSFFIGVIDNFQVSAFGLTDAKLKSLTCNKNELLSQAVLYYGFNEGTGVLAKDSSNSKADGQVVNGTWIVGAINPNSLQPILSFTDTTESPSLAVKFTNKSQNSASYKWTFGDGDSSNSINPYHSYPKPDTFRVCLEGQNECGRFGTKVCKDVVIVCPEPDIKLKSSVVGKKAIFNVDTASNYYLYAWDFGDKSWSKTGAKLSEVFKEFSNNGTYTVCAAVRSTCGRDTSCREIVIGPNGLLNSTTKASFKVYPNPFRNTLNIDNYNDGFIDFDVLNSVGESILKGSESSNQTIISSGNWAPGMYLIRVSAEGNTSVQRIVKQ